jgi:hypothetical protein
MYVPCPRVCQEKGKGKILIGHLLLLTLLMPRKSQINDMSFLEARSGGKTVNLPGKREILNISKNDV